jgi:hydroxypyruvate isomerase
MRYDVNLSILFTELPLLERPAAARAAALDASGYTGFVGLEYRPAGPSADSFGWLPTKENV